MAGPPSFGKTAIAMGECLPGVEYAKGLLGDAYKSEIVLF
jgi:hypothetical protein